MLTAISYAFRDQDTLAAVESVAAAGFSWVELWRGHRHGLGDGTGSPDLERAAKQLKQQIEARGVRVSTYCVGGITDDSAEQIERWARFALGLGTDIITGCLLRPERAAEIDGVLNRVGVRYAIENHKGIHFEGVEPYEALFGDRRVPNLGVNVDTGHFILAGVDPAAAVRRLNSRIFHVHLKDVPSEGHPRYVHSCPTGEGRLDVPAVLSALADVGYDGPVSVEYEDQEALPALKASLAYLTGLQSQRKGA